jgi:hypothetical protein
LEWDSCHSEALDLTTPMGRVMVGMLKVTNVSMSDYFVPASDLIKKD